MRAGAAAPDPLDYVPGLKYHYSITGLTSRISLLNDVLYYCIIDMWPPAVWSWQARSLRSLWVCGRHAATVIRPNLQQAISRHVRARATPVTHRQIEYRFNTLLKGDRHSMGNM